MFFSFNEIRLRDNLQTKFNFLQTIIKVPVPFKLM